MDVSFILQILVLFWTFSLMVNPILDVSLTFLLRILLSDVVLQASHKAGLTLLSSGQSYYKHG